MTPEEKKARKADDAKMLLNNPLLQETLSTLKETCFYNIETSSHDQQEEREDLYYMLRCITAFERQLKQYIQDGTVQVHNLNIKKILR
jgi:adenylosuccinate synthase